MMRRSLFKKSLCLIFAVFVLMSSAVFSVSADKYPSPKSNFFVNDFANVIESEDEEKIQALGERLFNASTAQVVAVTVENTGKESINEYALNLARNWGIGSVDKDNGVLLILCVEDREVRIEVGSGLEGCLTDAKTGRILDLYGLSYFKNDDFSAGIREVYSAIINEVCIEYKIETDEDYTPISEQDEEDVDISEILRIAIILIIIFAALKFGRRGGPRGGIPFFFFGGGNHHGGNGGGFGGGGGFSGGGSSRKF